MLEDLRLITEVVSSIVVIFGVPFGIYEFLKSLAKEEAGREKDRKAQEEHTYDELDLRYTDFQKLCLEYPHLDISDIPHPSASRQLSETEKKQEQIAFTILISLFERAYLMYRGHEEAFRERQWKGWDTYIQEYCRRENFRSSVLSLSESYDTGFVAYLQKIVRKAGLEDKRQPS